VNTFRCKHFRLEELVGPEIFKTYGDRCWELLRVGILVTIDTLQERYGKIVINDWLWSGQFHESGLRDPMTPTGAARSQHKFGGAFDLKFKTTTPIEVQKDILTHPENTPLLTTMENAAATVTWLHVDDRNHNQPGIWVVNP